MESDFIGKKFNRLTVLDEEVRRIGKYNKCVHFFKCQCDCGKITHTRKFYVIHGRVKSCGCYSREKVAERNLKHGQAKHGKNTNLYRRWVSMRSRCKCEFPSIYKNYGSRGISVCKEWDKSFEAFAEWAINNGYREDLTLDRIDVNGNYEPDNCRWITNAEQQNNRRDNVIIEIDGEEHNITEWIRLKGLNEGTIKCRIYGYGWDPKEAITTPVLTEKKVVAIFPDGSEKIFDSANAAASELSVNAKTIRCACLGKPKTYHGIVWKYAS